MKTKEEIINSKPVFLNFFKNEEDVFRNFESPYEDELSLEDAIKHAGEKVLFASYGQDNWTGDCFVLFTDGVELFEVNASHCSCYALENSWVPEVVVLEELKNRALNPYFGNEHYSGNLFKEELKEFLGI